MHGQNAQCGRMYGAKMDTGKAKMDDTMLKRMVPALRFGAHGMLHTRTYPKSDFVVNLKVFENTCVEPHIINHVCILLEAFQKKTSCKARAGVVMSRGVQACGLEIRVYILRNQMVHFGIGESDGANSATLQSAQCSECRAHTIERPQHPPIGILLRGRRCP